MLSIERSKAILNKGDRKYSDEEVKRLRDLLYQLAELEYEIFANSNNTPVKPKALKKGNK
jgi:hypothetical protein